MKTLRSLFALWVVLILILAGCSGNTAGENTPAADTLKYNDHARNIIICGSMNDAERNRLWVEDLEYFKTEFPKHHKNPFSVMTRETFNQRMDTLIAKVDKLNKDQICGDYSIITGHLAALSVCRAVVVRIRPGI
ncbi:MAG: hypothetical protein FWD61_16185 [Phycisphaerales bacterium]|nr:hypothetical protein [Phycisphaerales bacterium]